MPEMSYSAPGTIQSNPLTSPSQTESWRVAGAGFTGVSRAEHLPHSA